jgi:hypothetical protein
VYSLINTLYSSFYFLDYFPERTEKAVKKMGFWSRTPAVVVSVNKDSYFLYKGTANP